MQRDDHVKIQGKTAVYEPRREASQETHPDDALILDFQSPEP